LEENEVSQVGKEDPVKIHRDGTALWDSGNYEGTLDKFLCARAKIFPFLENRN
jgi:hypothetical protein